MTTEWSGNSESMLQKLTRACEEFFDKFPTEEDCRRFIYKQLRDVAANPCRSCDSSDFDVETAERLVRCAGCGRKRWITAGTFFKGAKKFQALLLAIWLLDRKIEFSANQLSEFAEVAYATAFDLRGKLMLLIEQQMQRCGALDGVEGPVYSYLFENLYGRRTRETPARQHPRAEEDEAMKRMAKKVDVTVEPAVSNAVSQSDRCYGEELASPDGQMVLSVLSNDWQHLDVLAAKTGLRGFRLEAILAMAEVDGVAVRNPGDLYSLPKSRPVSEITREIASDSSGIADFIAFVESTSQTIGRKYLQLYCALHWCLRNWPPGRLLSTCMTSGAISDLEMRGYVTGPMVTVSA